MSRVDIEQQQTLTLLGDSLAAYLRDNWSFNARRSAIESEAGWDRSIWNDLTHQLGLLTAAESEEHGGMGLGLTAQGIIASQLGEHLAITPYLETAGLASALIRGGGQVSDAALGAIAEGTIYAPALYEAQSRYNPLNVKTRAEHDGTHWSLSGHKRIVRAAPWASHLVVSAQTPTGLGLFIVDATAHGLSQTQLTLHDGLRAAEITLANTPAQRIHEDSDASCIILGALEEATYVLCAEAVGVMRRLTRATHDYVRQRKQFGLPIGAFQSLQFRLADMAMALEEAEAVLPATLEVLQTGDAALRARAVSAAKLTIDRACETIGTGAVQLHGAIGLTDELDVSHAFKRALMIQHEMGDAHMHATHRIAA